MRGEQRESEAVRITVDIDAVLLRRAERLSRETGRPLSALVEEGLRLALKARIGQFRYRLPDFSFGSENAPDPLAAYSWPELRDIIYGENDFR